MTSEIRSVEKDISTCSEVELMELKQLAKDYTKQYNTLENKICQLQEERDFLSSYLEKVLAKVDSLQSVSSSIRKQHAIAEKEKSLLELEIEEIKSKHIEELSIKATVIEAVEEKLNKAHLTINQLKNDKYEMALRITQLKAEVRFVEDSEENAILSKQTEKLRESLSAEKLLKTQAVNKLVETLNCKLPNGSKDKEKQRSKQRDKVRRKLKMSQERVKFFVDFCAILSHLNRMKSNDPKYNIYQEIKNYSNKTNFFGPQQLNKEMEEKAQLKMDVIIKGGEIEKLQAQLKSLSEVYTDRSAVERVEDWLSVSNEKDTKKYDWKKQLELTILLSKTECHAKRHKKRVDKQKQVIEMCRVTNDTEVVRKLLILAESAEEQNNSLRLKLIKASSIYNMARNVADHDYF
ncbi:Rho-associated protein kinase 2 [Trichoplax sp. H2]|nr:Rho-associated protein kinase 2 [Trichoplax sp. H2]|eukprot:RDD41620.1 Rho-associated protein kinase 2 [Trichoplax sp. H2]